MNLQGGPRGREHNNGVGCWVNAHRTHRHQLAARGQWEDNYGGNLGSICLCVPSPFKGCFPWLAQLGVQPPLRIADWSSSQGSQLPVCSDELPAVRRCWQEQLDIREWWKEREIHWDPRQNGPLGSDGEKGLGERTWHLLDVNRTAAGPERVMEI